jgi:hypothetical protein
LTRLSELLAGAQHATRYEVAIGDVDPLRAVAAARAVTMDELPLARLLFRLRGIPARNGAFVDSLPEFDLLVDEPDELVLVAVGKPWTLRAGILHGVDAATFAEPGYAKLGMDLRAEPGRLVTETRVELTDARAQRLFRPYWLVVKPFSALIRRLWLRAALERLRAT